MTELKNMVAWCHSGFGGNSGVGVCGDVEFTELVEVVDIHEVQLVGAVKVKKLVGMAELVQIFAFVKM